MQEVFFLVSCLCATEGARHELHAATGTERLVVLLHHVVCTQRSATDAAGAVGHKYLGTVLTDVTGALCRGRRHAHIRHFAGDTRAYLSHRLSPWACSPMLSYPTRSPGLLSAWHRRDRSATIAYLHHLMRLASPEILASIRLHSRSRGKAHHEFLTPLRGNIPLAGVHFRSLLELLHLA